MRFSKSFHHAVLKFILVLKILEAPLFLPSILDARSLPTCVPIQARWVCTMSAGF